MKKKIYLLIFGPLFLALHAWAQEDAADSRGLSPEEYQWAKSLEIPNLEKDSYLKKEGLIFDRENPPFTFSFSDGKKRKLFLFQIFETQDLKSLGQLAIYQFTDAAQEILIAQPIPTQLAPKAVWDLYMDDLKAQNQREPSFSTCLAFALSRQTGPLAREEGDTEEEEYEYCFPADARVQMAHGESRAIAHLKPGDWVLAGDPDQPETWVPYPLKSLVKHQKVSPLWTIELLAEDLLATSQESWALRPRQIRATGNHPIATPKGPKRMDTLIEGDLLFILDAKNKQKIPYRVHAIHPAREQVDLVYNLVLDAPAYLVDGFMVYQK